MKGKEQKVKNKKVEFNLQLHAHNGSRFDTWIILKKLPCDKHIVDFIKTGKNVIEIKQFIGYVQNSRKQVLYYLHFRCGMIFLKY